MFIIDTYGTAVLFCLITMLCWGSWANTQKLAAGSWRFELFYWDYVLGIVALAFLSALTLGSLGEGGRSFLAESGRPTPPISARRSGAGCFSTRPIFCWGRPLPLRVCRWRFRWVSGWRWSSGWWSTTSTRPWAMRRCCLAVWSDRGGHSAQRLRLPPDGHQHAPAYLPRGLLLSVVAGCLMGLFYGYVAQAMFPNFAVPEPGKLSPYTAVCLFSMGILLSNFLFNTLLMRRPFVGTPVSYADYFRGSGRDHLTGILGGMIWCLGMSFSILASDKAGPAISYGLGQGATVVAAFWGIYIWKEFRDAPKGVNACSTPCCSVTSLASACSLLPAEGPRRLHSGVLIILNVVPIGGS